MTLLCIFTPVRSLRSWFCPAVAIFSYIAGAAAIAGNSEFSGFGFGGVLQLVILSCQLMTLFCFALFGRRKIEKDVRLSFANQNRLANIAVRFGSSAEETHKQVVTERAKRYVAEREFQQTQGK